MKQTLNRTLCSLLAAAALAAGLSACAPLVVGGAVVGTMMAVDRRTTGTQVEDEGIELRSVRGIESVHPAVWVAWQSPYSQHEATK